MQISEFITSMPADRHATLTAIHQTILANDSNVTAVIKPMMGKEMILYEECKTMKYGLASAKAYMSLHCLPMYMDKAIYSKYEALAPNAKFQKGCINFNNEEELPLSILTSLITDCASINIAEVLANRKKK